MNHNKEIIYIEINDWDDDLRIKIEEETCNA